MTCLYVRACYHHYRRGKDILCRVSINSLSGVQNAVHGVILLMEEQGAE